MSNKRIKTDINFLEYPCHIVNYKSKEPTIHEDFKINGQIVSMDYVMVKNVDIPIKDYIFFLRGKKLSQITNGIL